MYCCSWYNFIHNIFQHSSIKKYVMKVNRAHRACTHGRQAKEQRRRLLIANLICVLLLLAGGYGVVSSGQDVPAPPAATPPLPPPSRLPKDVPLDWPVSGQAAVGSVDDGLLARSSRNEEPRPTASIAKVITALAIMEKQPFKPGQPGQSYTLTAQDVAIYRAYAAKDGSTLPVYEGMVLTQYQALQAMLIVSANNIADTMVERVFGSTEAYISYARGMLQRMNLNRTVIADASGFDPATTSTPSDLVSIGIAALKNPTIAEIVAQPEAAIPGVGVIKNTNELLGTEGTIGIKTGTTNQAGSCLLFAVRYADSHAQKVTLVGVIMGDSDAASLFADSSKLLASAKQKFGLAAVPPAGTATAPRQADKDRAP